MSNKNSRLRVASGGSRCGCFGIIGDYHALVQKASLLAALMFNVIFQPISNREVWQDQFEVLDQDNALVDLSSAVIVLSVGEPKTGRITLTASTDDATITIVSTGIFIWTFTLEQTRTLCLESYNVGCTIDLGDGLTHQLFVGTISVIDGVVA